MSARNGPHVLVSLFGANGAVRALIVAGVLVLAWRFGQSPSLNNFMLPLLAAAVLILLKYPPLGLAALLLLGMVAPWGVGTGTRTTLPYVYVAVPVLLGLWFVNKLVYQQEVPKIHWSLSMPLSGMMVTTAVSWLAGYVPWNPFAVDLAPVRAQAGAAGMFVFSACLFFLAAWQVDSLKWLKIIVGIFVVLGSLYIVGRAFQLPWLVRLLIPSATGSMFWGWYISLSMGLALFNVRLQWYVRVLLLALTGLAFYVAFSQAGEWASGWVVMLASLGAMFFIRWPRLGLVAVPAGIVVLAITYEPLLDLVLTGDNAYSLLTRQAALEILYRVIESNPLLGVGPANYYYFTPLYSILGWYVQFNSHNQYLDILAQIGIIGLALILGFFVAIAVRSIKLRRNSGAEPFAAAYVAACLAGLAATLVAGMLGDWFLPFVYNVGVAGFRASMLPWLFFGGLAALERLVASQTSAPAQLEDLSVDAKSPTANQPERVGA